MLILSNWGGALKAPPKKNKKQGGGGETGKNKNKFILLFVIDNIFTGFHAHPSP